MPCLCPQEVVASDRGPQFTSRVWQTFCAALGVTVSLSSGGNLQSNGQTERANQSLKSATRCGTPPPGAPAPGISPFMAAQGYQPPLFDYQEEEVAIPSVQANFCRCKSIWWQVNASLLHSSLQSHQWANCCRVTALCYRLGQKVRLASRDLLLQVDLRKMAPQFVWPFEVEWMINPAAIRLKLSASVRVHLTFHVSRVQPVTESDLSLPADDPPRCDSSTVRRPTRSRRS